LCGYWPRKIVEREGQQVGNGAKVLWKVFPLLLIRSSISGILQSRDLSASSVSTNRKFGFSPPIALCAARILPPSG